MLSFLVSLIRDARFLISLRRAEVYRARLLPLGDDWWRCCLLLSPPASHFAELWHQTGGVGESSAEAQASSTPRAEATKVHACPAEAEDGGNRPAGVACPLQVPGVLPSRMCMPPLVNCSVKAAFL
eukprot:3421658-Pleurochrysis_carterae.AAC.2